ncbi:hypothetical protein KKI24_23840 [bacterium]|nr:hypothetical protein [bacterium]
MTEWYLSLATQATEADVSNDCEPSGVSLRIDITPPYGDICFFLKNEKWIELGEVSVEINQE